MTAIGYDKLASLYPNHLDTVRDRYAAALAGSGFDRTVIFSGAERYLFLDDMPYPFKVNPYFKSWLPIVDNPHCFIVYEPEKRPLLVYWQPIDYWYKRAGAPSGYWTSHFDIEVIGNETDARGFLPRGGRTAWLGEFEGPVEGQVNPEALLSRIDFARAWKTEYEIECMRLANDVGVRGHLAAERAFRNGSSEYEIHIDYLRASGQTEGELPYSNIIALNENAAVLHYHAHDHTRLDPARRHSFLIDAGGSANGYASDITRTYSRERDEFAELIEAMDTMQQELVGEVQPGLDYPDLHLLAHQKIGGILERFGFVRDVDAEGTVAKGITSTFFPHGVGHYIGLQVHDVGAFLADESGKTIDKPAGHPFLRLTRKVEPTHVFTIEPGLYFIDSLLGELEKSESARYVNWQKVDTFRKFGGIRIEDDVVVRPEGHENLTRDAFARIGNG
jgi:Xaa-Pro dipeptidase